MYIKNILNGDRLSIVIDGHVTGLSEFTELKSVITSNSQANIIELKLNDAYVIPSMLIGYLIKIIDADKKKVIMKCAKAELKELITNLNLHTIIDVS